MKRLLILWTFFVLTVNIQSQSIIRANPFYTAPAAPSTLLTGLVAAYDFEEASGDLIDLVGSVDGTLVNTPTVEQTGKVGYAYSFAQASDEKVTLGTTLGNSGTNDFSVSVWFNLTTIDRNNHILGKYDGSDFYWMIHMSWDDNKVRVTQNLSGSGVENYYNTALTTGVWYHFVLVLDRSGLLYVYVNGTERTTRDISTLSAVDLTNTSNLTIADRTDNPANNNLDGLEDMIRVWSKALSPEEVTELYTKENTGTTYPW
jgi:hypothetical protein